MGGKDEDVQRSDAGNTSVVRAVCCLVFDIHCE